MTSYSLAQVLGLEFQPCLTQDDEEIIVELKNGAVEELVENSKGQFFITYRGFARHLNVSEFDILKFMAKDWYESDSDEEFEYWCAYYDEVGLSETLMFLHPLFSEREILPIEWIDIFSYHFLEKKRIKTGKEIEINHNNFIIEKLKEFLSTLPEEDGKTVKYKFTSEKSISDRLAKKEKGQREVQCKNGRVDVITSRHLIEVKTGKGWKNALGQLSAYHPCFPHLQKRLHLFDYYHCDISEIERICKEQNVILTLEPHS